MMSRSDGTLIPRKSLAPPLDHLDVASNVQIGVEHRTQFKLCCSVTASSEPQRTSCSRDMPRSIGRGCVQAGARTDIALQLTEHDKTQETGRSRHRAALAAQYSEGARHAGTLTVGPSPGRHLFRDDRADDGLMRPEPAGGQQYWHIGHRGGSGYAQ